MLNSIIIEVIFGKIEDAKNVKMFLAFYLVRKNYKHTILVMFFEYGDKIMSEQKQNGYIIQMYQYARRYRYNYQGSIRYINYLSDETKDVQNSAYMALGDFDMLEVTPVHSFRK